jgi:2-polyprenyl-6-methoxyphenol hydroxylase-like FAD-dependent oxidoreductase
MHSNPAAKQTTPAAACRPIRTECNMVVSLPTVARLFPGPRRSLRWIASQRPQAESGVAAVNAPAADARGGDYRKEQNKEKKGNHGTGISSYESRLPLVVARLRPLVASRSASRSAGRMHLRCLTVALRDIAILGDAAHMALPIVGNSAALDLVPPIEAVGRASRKLLRPAVGGRA